MSFSDSSDSQCRRDTFDFNEIMYSDQTVEVTPSLLLFDGYYRPFLGTKEIPIQDIDGVWRDFGSHVSPTHWLGSRSSGLLGTRKLIRNMIRSPSSTRPTRNNLLINVKDGKSFRVNIRAEDPNEAYHAIRAAMNTFY